MFLCERPGLTNRRPSLRIVRMRSSIQYYFNLAKEIAQSKSDKRFFLVGSVGVRKDGVIVGAPNAPTPEPERKTHSEYRTCQKLDHHSTVYVARILRKNGDYAIARPCYDCANVLRSKRVKKVYYTISPNEYGIFDPYSNTDTYFRF